jgi:hypothetical protein
LFAFELQSGKQLPPAGVHFGSEFLAAPEHHIYQWLPQSYERRITNQFDYWGIYVFDIWAHHQDQRECVFRQSLNDGAIQVFFIDNGHIFGGPEWTAFAGKCRSLFLPSSPSQLPTIEQQSYGYSSKNGWPSPIA